jgi:hypothetical protein
MGETNSCFNRTQSSISLFDLKPPGAFPACIDQSFAYETTRELEFAVAIVKELSAAFPISGVLLTGSFARGEGIIRRSRNERGSQWLSDLECLVVIPDSARTHLRMISDALAERTRIANEEDQQKSRGQHIELSPILTARLRTMKPSIFAYELIEHGKLLWRSGGHEVPMPPRFELSRTVLGRDALRLLNNRIMEQVAASTHCSEQQDPAETAYLQSKFWVEMGTSISVFLECYQSSYKARYEALENVVADANLLPLPFGNATLSTILRAMRARVAPDGCRATGPSGDTDCAAALALKIWWWETANILNTSPLVGDWSEIGARLRRTDTTDSRLRDWGRVLLRKGIGGNFTIASIASVLQAGSLGSAIYTAGCLLFFYREAISQNSVVGAEIYQRLRSFLGINPPAGAVAHRCFSEVTALAWQKHLRSTAL